MNDRTYTEALLDRLTCDYYDGCRKLQMDPELTADELRAGFQEAYKDRGLRTYPDLLGKLLDLHTDKAKARLQA